MRNGTCRYAYNPSEIYQRTRPGQGVETSCGAFTWPAVDEPELGAVRLGDGSVEYRPTGRQVERAQADPYCPAHGGSPEPPPPPVSMAELEASARRYAEMLERYRAQQQLPAPEVPQLAPPPPGEVTADEVTAAARAYTALASQAAASEAGHGI